MPKANAKTSGLPRFPPPLLITESSVAYRALKGAFVARIGPRDVLEEIHLSDFVDIVWDIARLRRCKPSFINQAYFSALCDLIAECSDVRGEELRNLAESWFTDEGARRRVDEMLARRKLDETAIEAKALGSCIAQMEQLERMLAALESRRDRALRSIFECRPELARVLEQHSNDIMDSTRQLRFQPSTAA